MNWKYLRWFPGLDTRAGFVARVPQGGTLLDMGSSDGETLGHIAELRPDLRLRATDLAGAPERYPAGCEFHRGDLERERLPWGSGSVDAITCMHLVEHLRGCENLFGEAARLLRAGGRIYVETPHPKTMGLDSPPGVAAGTFTLNFFDDLTHVRPVTTGGLAQLARRQGLVVEDAGTSRNWLFAAAYPVLRWLPASRQRFTAQIHWQGWSAYLIARKPA